MFYSNHDLAFKIRNIYHVKRGAEKTYNTSRKWSAISFRNSGSSVFTSGDITVTAAPGSILYIPKKASYFRESSEEDMIIIHLDVFGEEQDCIQLFSSGDTAGFSKEFYDICKTWTECSPGYVHKCTAMLHGIFAKMEAFDFKNPQNRYKAVIKNSLMFMNMNFDNPDITIGEIARQSNISEVYFRKLYNKIYGMSPKSALQDMRLARAENLLQSGYYNISEAAEKSGFENVKYFSTLFHKKIGMTPGEYTKKQRGF